MSKQRYLLIGLIAATAAACGDDEPSKPTEPDPVFEATITGDLTGTVQGEAYFGSAKDENQEDVFALVLGMEDSSTIILATQGTARPATGVHDIATPAEDGSVPPGDWVGIFLLSEGTSTGFFVSTDGSLDIDVSDNDQLEGSFAFDAAGFISDDPETLVEITIAGTFDAAHATIPGIPTASAGRILAPVR